MDTTLVIAGEYTAFYFRQLRVVGKRYSRRFLSPLSKYFCFISCYQLLFVVICCYPLLFVVFVVISTMIRTRFRVVGHRYLYAVCILGKQVRFEVFADIIFSET